MENNGPMIYIIILLLMFVNIFAVILEVAGIYLLMSQTKRRISDLLLAHFTFVELVFVVSHWRFKDFTVESLIAPYPSYVQNVHTCLIIQQVLSLLLLSFDRVLAVKFPLRYKVIITKTKLYIGLVISWVISASHMLLMLNVHENSDGVHDHSDSESCFQMVDFVWSCISVVGLSISYIYIIFKVERRRKRLFQQHGDTLQTHSQNLKYKVPFVIILTSLLFMLIPGILMFFVHSDLIVVIAIALFWLNYLSDPLVYILGSKKIKERLVKFWKIPFRREHTQSQTSATSSSSTAISTTMC